MATLCTRLTERDLDKRIADKAHPLGCTGNCNQGRMCDCNPTPAEACTEVGAEPAGHHRTSLLIVTWLAVRRWLI